MRSIRHDLGLRRDGVRATEPGDRPRTVGQDNEVTVVEASVGDARLVHPHDRPPEILDEDIAHLGRVDLRQ